MPQVIGFGALNVDNIFKVENLNLSENPAFPIDVQAGGNAANTIDALAKLGIPCGFVGVVTNDAFGKLILSEFKRRKVDISQIIRRKAYDFSMTSGLVETYVDKKGRRALFVKPGVNSFLSQKEVNKNYFQNASFIHLSSFVDETQLKIQKSIVAKIPSGVKISFAPGSLYCERGLKALKPIIQKTYILFLAKKETYHLTGKSFKKAVNDLLRLGPKIVVITLGEKGCLVATSKEHLVINTRKVRVVDTTGAGDAFAAGFLFGLLKNLPIKKCAEIGNAVASFSVQKIGARAGLPNRKELFSVVSLPK